MKRFLLFSASLLITLMMSVSAQAQSNAKELSLEDIWASRRFVPKSTGQMVPMQNGEDYAFIDERGICKSDYLTDTKVSVIAPVGKMIRPGGTDTLQIEDFSFSSDESRLLLTTESEAIYRYSEKSNFYILKLPELTLTPLSTAGKQRLADFSPDSRKVAFIRDNNLFYKDLDNGKEHQITSDGKFGSIINGSTDWVYEEELDLIKAFFWSPDGSKIAYLKFDESAVKEFTFIEYGDLYTTPFSYKYPKAGENNSIVTVWVYDVATGKSTAIETGPETDQYIPRIYWTHQSKQLLVYRMNRLQNKLELLLADPASGKSHVAWTETNKYYVDITDNFYLMNDDRRFVMASERDGYNHLWMFSLDSDEKTLLTPGNFDVIALKNVDEKNQKVYYTASELSSWDQSLYGVSLNGKGKNLLSSETGICTPDFIPGGKYYISRWSDANTPPVVTLCDTKGKVLRNMISNQDLKNRMMEYGFVKKEFTTFKSAANTDLPAWIMKPAGFSPDKKYPVLMYVYGGPNSLSVKNSWGYYDYLWYQLLAQKGYVIVCVDNRGCGGKGEEFRKCTYMQLGKYETEDQIAVAKYLAGQSWVDAKRIGIWGWSYGGFVTSLCMTKGADVFKTGIAVAPVTNWRNYDNIYTERFMRTPQENPSGYDQNSPANFAALLKGNLLIVHGSSDDNVHMQNTMEFVDKLVKANKQFEMQIYPNKNHSIYGGKTRLHLYTRMTNFLLRCL
jgi:dipeptidyl-peptidase-4